MRGQRCLGPWGQAHGERLCHNSQGRSQMAAAVPAGMPGRSERVAENAAEKTEIVLSHCAVASELGFRGLEIGFVFRRPHARQSP
jgi:hypothetical protein